MHVPIDKHFSNSRQHVKYQNKHEIYHKILMLAAVHAGQYLS